MGELPGSGLIGFLIDEADEQYFRVLRSASALGHIAERLEKCGHAALGITRAASVQSPVFDDGLELLRLGRHDIHVRREDNTALHLAGRGKAHQQVFASGQHGLPPNIEVGLAGAIDQQFSHTFLAADGRVIHKRGVDAGSGDQIAE